MKRHHTESPTDIYIHQALEVRTITTTGRGTLHNNMLNVLTRKLNNTILCQPPHLKAKSHLNPADLILPPAYTRSCLPLLSSSSVIHPSAPPNIPHFSLANACKQPLHTPSTPTAIFKHPPPPAPCWPQNHLSRVTDVFLHKNICTDTPHYVHMHHKHSGNTPAPALTLRNAGTSWRRK